MTWLDLSARASMVSHRLIGWIYWDPVAIAAYKALGFDEGSTYYINSRFGPLAPAGPQVVAATAYTILPLFIELSMQLVEERSTFAEVVAVRDNAVAVGLTDYAPEICEGLAALSESMWAVADDLPIAGRAMFAAHRQYPRPTDDDVLSGWLAVNCIREWRGDTHFAVLAEADISAVQAGILHNDYLNYPAEWIPRSRGADDASLAIAMAEMTERGLVKDGVVSAEGRELRERIEARTNEICERPWRLLGEPLTHTFIELIEPIGERFIARINETAGPEWMPAARPRRS